MVLLFILVATVEYEANLRHKNEMLRLEAELKGKYVTAMHVSVIHTLC